MIILIVTGCSSHSQVVVKNRVCSSPARVELSPLDNSTHLASKKNTAILMLNIADLVAYVKSLEAAIKCYHAQEVPSHSVSAGGVSPTKR